MKFRGVLATVFASAALLISAAAVARGGQQQTTTVLPETDNAAMDQWYSLGAKGAEVQFRLKKYMEVRLWFATPDENYFAKKHERLMKLFFTMKNPLKRDVRLGSRTFNITIMGLSDQNSEFRGYLMRPNGQRLDQTVKANQSVECMIVMPYHDLGPVGKIIVEYGEDHSLTYVIPDNVLYPQSPFLDKHQLNETAEVPVGRAADIKGFNVTLMSKNVTTDKIKGYNPDKGFVYVVYTFKYENLTQLPNPLGFQYFTPQVKDSTNREITWNRDILAEKEDVTFAQSVDKGDSVIVRYYFMVKEGLQDSLKFRLTDTTSEKTFIYKF